MKYLMKLEKKIYDESKDNKMTSDSVSYKISDSLCNNNYLEFHYTLIFPLNSKC